MKIVIFFTICILLYEILSQPFDFCRLIKDEINCKSRKACSWYPSSKSCEYSAGVTLDTKGANKNKATIKDAKKLVK